MEIKEIQAAIEAILFVSGEPVSIERISQMLEIEKATVIKITSLIKDKFDSESSGIMLKNMGEDYQLCSKPQYGEYIRKVMDMRRNIPLSSAAMEVLAIIAYNQPVTKAFVEQIRGVDSSGVVSSLVTKGLIEEKGRLEIPGRPLLYATTDIFLRSFDIESLDQLPPLPKQADKIDQETQFLIESNVL